MDEAVKIVKLSKDEWATFSQDAHRAVFDEIRPAFMDRIDYALIFDVGGQSIGFATIRELDNESAYIQFGGKYDGVCTPHLAVEAISMLTEKLLTQYERITCLVRNDNIRFLKIALHVGMKAVGCRTFKNEIFLEMLKERKGD